MVAAARAVLAWAAMQRREFFGWIASSAAVASTSIVVGSGCQQEAAPSKSFVDALRKVDLPDTIEPAFAFRPLPRAPR